MKRDNKSIPYVVFANALLDVFENMEHDEYSQKVLKDICENIYDTKLRNATREQWLFLTKSVYETACLRYKQKPIEDLGERWEEALQGYSLNPLKKALEGM